MVDAHNRLEVLRERLKLPDVTVDEVREYAVGNHPPLSEQVQQLAVSFVTEQDIADFHLMRAWWAPVKDKPLRLQAPMIEQFCWFINYHHANVPVTFRDAMLRFSNQAVAHCVASGLDIAQPAESKEARKTRLNRERMRKVRGHRSTPDRLLVDPVIREQVRNLEAQAAEQKQLAKAADQQLRSIVVGYQEQMLSASANRKRVGEQFKAQIDSIRAEIIALTAKQ